ncbi:MAG: A/G-specific adenine glycosylase [Bacteroidota bacterium]|nr:A/G-specific adenine glycosylase [Bacteroidota bacterium]MDP4248080.1 A/G-specific adenine glycosylase [Bacteroidota bacterium]MDP4253955.1 A/G-specific adenine glycosylase [Bacteroidota bacterium]MDP4258366.1 A/G-specific adenine glycosylase [Bacteroidota bacterium]
MGIKSSDFTKLLLKWHKDQNNRSMPWKGEKDPYKVWLSEIILQQTRVEQGLAYYNRFVSAFPDLRALARAPEQKVFKLWEGLGYYNRCRNLIETARMIVREHGGQFPSTYEEIRKLKGVGPYTAAAIASFAFDLPHAVVDGNVERVLSRYFGISTPVDTAAGKRLYAGLASSLLARDQPGAYNQSIMDFGAMICKPRNPLCPSCVQRQDCQARIHGWIEMLPVKGKGKEKRRRWLNYLFVETPEEQVYIRERKGKDIWQGLHELVLWETDGPLKEEEISGSLPAKELFGKGKLTVKHISRPYRQELSHQTIEGFFIIIRLEKAPRSLGNYFPVRKKELLKYAFPKFINAWLLDPSPVPSLF